MSRKNRERRQGAVEAGPQSGPGREEGGGGWVPTVLAIAALAASAFLWFDARSARKEDAAKFAEVEGRIAALAQTVASAQRPPQPQGPDPNKIYPVKLDGAPVRGNPAAPIVIAEFSDFQ